MGCRHRYSGLMSCSILARCNQPQYHWQHMRQPHSGARYFCLSVYLPQEMAPALLSVFPNEPNSVGWGGGICRYRLLWLRHASYYLLLYTSRLESGEGERKFQCPNGVSILLVATGTSLVSAGKVTLKGGQRSDFIAFEA